MTDIGFVKLHGLGNDFIVVDARGLPDPEKAWRQRAIAWCDRHFGIGADGLLLALPPTSGADVRMQIINADGSEPEMCGNGIRCFARFLVDAGEFVRPDHHMTVETLAGTMGIEYRTGADGRVEGVRVDMGPPAFTAAAMPLAPAFAHPAGPILTATTIDVDGAATEFVMVSMGNPHAIAFVDAPIGDLDLARIGPPIEHDPRFPRRSNVEFVNRTGPERLAMRVWERGAGMTLACGTGACAVAVADIVERGGTRRTVDLPGGSLEIEWAGEGPVFMTGPVAEVFRGVVRA